MKNGAGECVLFNPLTPTTPQGYVCLNENFKPVDPYGDFGRFVLNYS